MRNTSKPPLDPPTLEQRLVASVQRRLNTSDVAFVRWIPKVTGDVPVFRVPPALADRARHDGLTVETR